jgi:exonuclease III
MAIRSKILETGYDIICLQETKKEFFDQSSIKRFCPSSFDCFEFIPSVGASRGTIILWKSNRFTCRVIDHNGYTMSMEFVSTFLGATWVLTNIYAPCTLEGKLNFLNWLHDFELPEGTNWLLVGDFNMIR